MRIKWIDTAKGIAMLCVILGHMGGITIAGVNLNFVYAFHLSVFFLLSGYTLKKKEITKEYINDKFVRLMAPYFWTCFFVLIVDILNQVILWKNASIINITDVIANNLVRFFFASGAIKTFAGVEMATVIGAIWFLPAMFFATLIVQFVLNFTEKTYLRWCVTLIVAILGYMSSDFIWFPFSIQSACVMAAFILLGYYLREYEILNHLKKQHYIIFLLIFIYAVCTDNAHVAFVSNFYPDIVLSMILSVTSTLLIFKLSSFCEEIKFLNYIGNNSLYYLAAHLFALEVLNPYFYRVFSKIGLSANIANAANFVSHVIFSTIVVQIILFVKDKFNGEHNAKGAISEKRDYTIDFMKGILIILMLIGHRNIDTDLRNVIYSFHMVAFIFTSGYFYKKRNDVIKSILHTAKGIMVPYVFFCLFDFLINKQEMGTAIMKYIFGMSFSNKFLVNVLSVGPIYFVLLLFFVKVIYLLIDNFVSKESIKIAIVLLVSYVGVLLGKVGIWLPWSFDCAMYAIVFYMIGHYCKKYNVLGFLKEHLVLYFVLVSIWGYMIYKGGMEIAIRLYEPYGIVIAGAVSAVMLLQLLCSYICEMLPRGIVNIGTCVGENTIYILLVHTLIGGYITDCVGQVLDINYIYFLTAKLLIEVMLGVGVGVMISRMKRLK